MGAAATPVRHVDGLAVYRLGDGPPVLLMPGPHRYARPGLRRTDLLIEGLVGIGRQVVTFDPPGSGRSTRPARVDMAEMHDCADEALAACAVRTPVDAVGHSMAGLVLLAHALDHPGRVRRLVLIGTGSGGPAYMRAPGALWNRSHPDFWGMALLGILQTAWPARAPERLMNAYIERRSLVDSDLVTRERIAPSDWLRRREGRPGWHWTARRLDYSARLAELTAPTLVLCGRLDPQFPPACSMQLADAIPRAELVWFASSGHYPHVEEPAAFWRAVDEFLSRPLPAAAHPDATAQA